MVAGCRAGDGGARGAAVQADSLEERRAEAIVQGAQRGELQRGAAFGALVPAAYAHDSSFAASVLAEERALASAACQNALSVQVEADARLMADQRAQGRPGDLVGRALEGTPVWACVEREVRRAYPLRTAADSARDSTRLVIRERFRRAVYARVLAHLAAAHGPDRADRELQLGSRDLFRFQADASDSTRFDPTPEAAVPTRYDVGRAAYHFPRPRRVDPESRDTVP